MKAIIPSNTRTLGLTLCLLLQIPLFGQTSKVSDEGLKPAQTPISPGDLAATLKKSKNSPSYVFRDDALYQEFVRISETKPTDGPRAGVGDAGSLLANCVIKPAEQAGPDARPYFIASIDRRTSVDKNGNATEREVKSLLLWKVSKSKSAIRYQCIGGYSEKENLEMILQALRKAADNPPFKEGSDDFDVASTTVFRRFTDKALHEEISRISQKHPKLEDDDQTFDPDGISCAEVDLHDALLAPALIIKKETYWKLLLSEDGRIALFQYRRDGSYCDYELENMGVFRATAEWEKLCRRMIETEKDSKD